MPSLAPWRRQACVARKDIHNEAFLACRGQLLRRVRAGEVDAQHRVVRAVFGSGTAQLPYVDVSEHQPVAVPGETVGDGPRRVGLR